MTKWPRGPNLMLMAIWRFRLNGFTMKSYCSSKSLRKASVISRTR